MLEDLKNEKTHAKTIEILRISDQAGIDLINFFNAIADARTIQSGKAYQHNFTKSPKSNEKSQTSFKPEEEIGSARTFFLDAIRQVKKAHTTSMIMSTVMFIVGVCFLFLAGFQAITNPESIGTTAVVGGIGISQIVILFYRKPLADIARSMSNAQQAKVAIVSYLFGLYYINNSASISPNEKHIENLLKLTENTISQLKVQKE